MFQIYDEDADGVISCEDLFKVHQLVEAAEMRGKLEEAVYKLKDLIEDRGVKPGVVKGQTLLEYLSKNHTLTLREVLGVLD